MNIFQRIKRNSMIKNEQFCIDCKHSNIGKYCFDPVCELTYHETKTVNPVDGTIREQSGATLCSSNHGRFNCKYERA